MKIVTTATFDGLFGKLTKRIQKKAADKTELFKSNPFDPSLRTEKLHPKHYQVWSFRVDRNYRIVFRFLNGDTAEFLFVGHHNKIYDYDFLRQ